MTHGLEYSIGRAMKSARLAVKPLFYLLKGRRILADPAAYIRRRKDAKSLTENSSWQGFVDAKKGYGLFGPEDLPGTQEVIALCRRAYEEHIAAHEARHPGKPFLSNMLTPKELETYPELLDFALSDAVIEIVTDYLGTVPILRGIGIFQSPVNETQNASQKFHIDTDDFRQLKCFINVFEHGEGAGPLSFLTADKSDVVRSKLRHGWKGGRLEDEDVFDHCSVDDLLKLTGPAGRGVFVDTSRCLHFGSRAREVPRVMFMFQFTTYPNLKTDEWKDFRPGVPIVQFPTERYADDPLRLTLLGAQ